MAIESDITFHVHETSPNKLKIIFFLLMLTNVYGIS